MIKKLVIFAILLQAGVARAQDEAPEINKALPSFSRIVVSPKINLILTEGDEESIRLVYHRINPDEINIEVKGKTLRLYLDDSRVTEKMIKRNKYEKYSKYADANLTAYVTYRKLDRLEIRGEQELTCNSPIVSEKFILKGYGRNEINLTNIKTAYLKTHLYGENTLNIDGGKAEYQKYKLYGENKIDTRDQKSFYASATIFGESKLMLSIQDEIKVNAFGESEVTYGGNASLNRGLIFGKADIRRID